MSYTHTLLLYLSMLVGIMVIPGTDMGFVAGNALARGRHAGIAALSGIALGGATHTLIWSLGMATLLSSAPLVFDAITLAGALYLAWIGWSLVSAAPGADESSAPLAPATAPAMTPAAIAVRGVATCLLNPKAHLFMASVFPQFLQPEFGPLWRQALALGAMTIAVQIAVYGGVLAAALRGRERLIGRPATLRALLLVVGLAFMAGGAVAAAFALVHLLG